MSKVTVVAGPCRLKTEIIATKIDRNTVGLKIESQCAAFNALNDEIAEVNPYEEVMGKMGETKIFQAVKAHTKHAACPVACAVIKAVEIEAGLALPAAPEFTMEK